MTLRPSIRRKLFLTAAFILGASSSLSFHAPCHQRVQLVVSATVLDSSPVNKETSQDRWTDKVEELSSFARDHGHCMVPKRYKDNPSLGNWVNKMRQEYRKYESHQTPCSLTENRVDTLNELGFCWNATQSRERHHKIIISPEGTPSTARNERWIKTLAALKDIVRKQNGGIRDLSTYNCPSNISSWLRRQRNQYTKENSLESWQIDALSELDPQWWMTSHETKWETRFQELAVYVNENGHACVPITYKNRKLAHWVSNQRKGYKLLINGKKSDMTGERLSRLNSVGFVWDRWEFEFARRKEML